MVKYSHLFIRKMFTFKMEENAKKEKHIVMMDPVVLTMTNANYSGENQEKCLTEDALNRIYGEMVMVTVAI